MRLLERLELARILDDLIESTFPYVTTERKAAMVKTAIADIRTMLEKK